MLFNSSDENESDRGVYSVSFKVTEEGQIKFQVYGISGEVPNVQEVAAHLLAAAKKLLDG